MYRLHGRPQLSWFQLVEADGGQLEPLVAFFRLRQRTAARGFGTYEGFHELS
jgi:hypothetical protein